MTSHREFRSFIVIYLLYIQIILSILCVRKLRGRKEVDSQVKMGVCEDTVGSAGRPNSVSLNINRNLLATNK